MRVSPAAFLAPLLAGCSQGVLDPQGPVGTANRQIMLNALSIMLVIVMPTNHRGDGLRLVVQGFQPACSAAAAVGLSSFTCGMSAVATRARSKPWNDLAPGLTEPAEARTGAAIAGYVAGLVLSIALTVASFYVLGTPLVWGAAIPVALVVLGVAQIGVHLVFFLHTTTAPDNTNNALALAFGILIVVLIVGGSLWIMSLNHHMNHHMLTIDQVMRMQR